MIKFFRKIRQNLLIENKFSKYFLYAVGEIVLVVIGILIALGINNYNETIKSKENLNKSLYNISTELSLDEEFFKKNNLMYSRRVDYLNSLSNENYIEIDITNLFLQINSNSSLLPPSISYQSLIQQGKINEIIDKKLINQLNEYYNVHCPQYKDWVTYHQKSVSNLETVFWKSLLWAKEKRWTWRHLSEFWKADP